MTDPLVSIIIPIYNVENFLPQCVDSAINQTYSNLEIILINDGSLDNSGIICQEYAKKDCRIKYYDRKNVGASASRNFGIDVCTGDYIFFLDSDDYLSQDCISNLVDIAKSGKLAITGYYVDYSDENRVIKPEQSFGVYSNIHLFLIDFHKYFATKTNFIWGRLFKSQIIRDENIRFNPEIALGEDLLFDIEYYKFCNQGINLMEDCGYYYRQHGSATLSKKFDSRMFDWNEVTYAAIRDFLVEYDALTDENRRHLYNDILGNLYYSVDLLLESKKYLLKGKADIIRRYTSTQISSEMFRYATSKTFLGSLSYACIRCENPYVYILYAKMLNLLRKIKHAFI